MGQNIPSELPGSLSRRGSTTSSWGLYSWSYLRKTPGQR
uniref:Uncharacterized protein n=1 Tax=Anguilla anguilla TaxID=7936 RepID=A0A0E9X0Z8_ANGAN